jgi:hypothetical protein
LDDILRNSHEWNDREWVGKKWRPYFSSTLGFGGVPGGTTDEEINMPWFDVTDQKLIAYNMHNFETNLVVRAVVPQPGVVEIWRNAYIEPTLHDTTEVDQQTVYNELNNKKGDMDLLASFQLLDKEKRPRVLVKYLAGSLPSHTYPIRRALLVPLGPFIAIPFILLEGLFESLSTAFLYIFIVCGLLVGVLCFRGILSWPLQFVPGSQRRSRKKRKGVWGPAGPVDLEKSWNAFDEEKEVGLQRPKMARFGRDWKD